MRIGLSHRDANKVLITKEMINSAINRGGLKKFLHFEIFKKLYPNAKYLKSKRIFKIKDKNIYLGHTYQSIAPDRYFALTINCDEYHNIIDKNDFVAFIWIMNNLEYGYGLGYLNMSQLALRSIFRRSGYEKKWPRKVRYKKDVYEILVRDLISFRSNDDVRVQTNQQGEYTSSR